MVHALRESHRVLRPGGVLLDLRPAAAHRRIGLGPGRRWRPIGVMRESFHEDHAADRAIAESLRSGWFRRGARAEFLVDREMDTTEDFLAWLTDFRQRRIITANRALIRKLKRALTVNESTIVGRGLVTLQVLRKREPQAAR